MSISSPNLTDQRILHLENLPRSRTFYIATALSLLATLWLLVAMCTPNWIEADARLYNNHFDKLGLWVFCFRSFTDPRRRYHQYFTSCRWFFDYEWKFMYDVIAPSFFIGVQATFCIGFALLLISLAFLGMIWTRAFPLQQQEIMTATSFSHLAASFWFFMAYTIFGARAYEETWLPGWQNNYLSWSFGLCVIGGMKLFVVSILFYLEAQRLMKRKKRLKPAAGRDTSGETDQSDPHVQVPLTRSRQSIV